MYSFLSRYLVAHGLSLTEILKSDPTAHVACETLVKPKRRWSK